MAALLRYELLRWLRTGKLLLALFAAAFVGLSGPLSAFLLPQLIAGNSTNGLKITVADPTWRDLISSYTHTSSQVEVLILAFVAGTCSALGADDRLRLFYRSRTRAGARVFGPRLLVITLVSAGVTFFGAALALYETWTLVSGVDFGRASLCLLVGSIGLAAFIILAGAIAGLVNSPFVATLVVVALTFAGSLVPQSVEWLHWLPTRTLTPTTLLTSGTFSDYLWSIVSVVGLAGLATTFLLVRRLSNRSSRRETRVRDARP